MQLHCHEREHSRVINVSELSVVHSGEQSDPADLGSIGLGILPTGIGAIVREQMHRKNISLRELSNNGVISDRARRNLFQRIDAGQLSLSDMVSLYAFLDIDDKRAAVAVTFGHDPLWYFDQACQSLTLCFEEISSVFKEMFSAINGDFEPIERNLWRSYAAKSCAHIKGHQDRIDHSRRLEF